MMKRFIWITSVFVIIGIVSFFYKQSTAIPAFARKYRISCQTCHTPAIPKLKPYGDDFAGNGFRLEDYDAPRYYVETGDTKLSLVRDFPVSVRLDGHLTYNLADQEKSDLGVPYLMKFLSGGAISDNLSYYFYFYFDERGKVAGVEDAYLMYNNLAGTELDIYLGQFQVSDPLFKRELRLTLEDYYTYTTAPGMSDITLKYDRGIMLTYGFETGTDVIFELVNGNGLADAGSFHIFDKDKYKNVLGRVSQDIGENFRIGMFGYYGKEEITNRLGTMVTNTALIYGPDLTISLGKFELNGQLVVRNDDEVFLAPADIVSTTDINTLGGLGEIIFAPNGDQSDWYAAGLFNWIDSDINSLDYTSGTLHCGYLLRRNVRLVGEYMLNFSDTDNVFGVASMGFVSAF
ncbi:MAG: hypothetical protein ACLFUC_07835 [Bacteroidales bacterium]